MRHKYTYKTPFKTAKFRWWILATIVVAISCSPDDDLPNNDGSTCQTVEGTGTPYTLEVPYFFPTPVIPAYNPMTEEGVDLGRYLFWDTRLSRNNTISCASCHLPSVAFSDSARFSTGLFGETTDRHSMALVNMAWNKSFFWDGRASTLEDQILEPVQHPVEMGFTWPEAVERISGIDEYQSMFADAFGTPCVDSIRISFSIAQFIRTMISAGSVFDKAYRFGGVPLSPSEIRGMELFLAEAGDPDIFPGGQFGGDCFHCHGGGMIEFTDHQFHNNGLDSVFADPGRAGVTGNLFDEGLFRTPTLRNIALTAPYMHDGRFATLREVIEHYNSGGHYSHTLDPMMKMQGIGLGLSEQSIDDLVNFLHTLTDIEFVTNEAFSNPH